MEISTLLCTSNCSIPTMFAVIASGGYTMGVCDYMFSRPASAFAHVYARRSARLLKRLLTDESRLRGAPKKHN